MTNLVQYLNSTTLTAKVTKRKMHSQTFRDQVAKTRTMSYLHGINGAKVAKTLNSLNYINGDKVAKTLNSLSYKTLTEIKWLYLLHELKHFSLALCDWTIHSIYTLCEQHMPYSYIIGNILELNFAALHYSIHA